MTGDAREKTTRTIPQIVLELRDAIVGAIPGGEVVDPDLRATVFHAIIDVAQAEMLRVYSARWGTRQG